jgi:hypothetical protein
MTALIKSLGATVTKDANGTLHAVGVPAEQVGAKVAQTSLVLYELVSESVTLEEAVFELTKASAEYRGQSFDAEKPGSAGSAAQKDGAC